MTPDECAILLGGWSARAPDSDNGDTLGLWLWADGDEGMAAAWRTYEQHLRALAVLWGWAPRYWVLPTNEYGLRFVMHAPAAGAEGPYHYAEALAIAGPQQIAGRER